MKNGVRSLFVLVALSLALVATSGDAAAQGRVRIVVSVDWEGSSLDRENLDAMAEFRADYPQVPLQHFLNAAYYTKPGANAGQVTRAIRSVLRPGDEHALHIHGWKSLVEATGVVYEGGPTFTNREYSASECAVDCGHGVTLRAYSTEELRSLIRYSADVLEDNGFNRARSFRAGGWQADDSVLSALAREGFTVDSSATDASFLREKWGRYNLYRWVRELWFGIRSTTQPYWITLSGNDRIIELPNNGNLADYMTAQQMLRVFLDNASNLRRDPSRSVYISFGFHQESAARYLPRLREALDLIERYADYYDIPYDFLVGPF